MNICFCELSQQDSKKTDIEEFLKDVFSTYFEYKNLNIFVEVTQNPFEYIVKVKEKQGVKKFTLSILNNFSLKPCN